MKKSNLSPFTSKHWVNITNCKDISIRTDKNESIEFIYFLVHGQSKLNLEVYIISNNPIVMNFGL